MSNYIKNSLDKDEQILFFGRLHWVAIYQYLLSFFILLIIAGGLTASGYYMSLPILYFIGASFLLIAIGIYLWGIIIRSRCEFAVTTSRFIQKEGLLNIKMTEIPLFKIETVNYYQSFYQRIINTGNIELVGSGGTFHIVKNIENPSIIRKTIVGVIGKSQSKE